MTDLPLDSQVKALSSTFKSNLGTFLSRVQQQATAENGSTDIESLLTDLDRVISNQKELSELIQKVKLHQKISKELESTNEGIKTTQNSILSLIDELKRRDLEYSDQLLQAQALKINLKALAAIIKDPETALIASMNLAVTTGAPAGWTPNQPLITNKPPYPTEDLIRRSALYQMMTQPIAIQSQDQPTKSKLSEEVSISIESKSAAAPTRGRRRGAAADKSKLLDLDLNPDM